MTEGNAEFVVEDALNCSSDDALIQENYRSHSRSALAERAAATVWTDHQMDSSGRTRIDN